jgi:hypothetical protein
MLQVKYRVAAAAFLNQLAQQIRSGVRTRSGRLPEPQDRTYRRRPLTRLQGLVHDWVDSFNLLCVSGPQIQMYVNIPSTRS